MQNMDIRNISMGDILCFVKVVEYNSFTRAAEHFHLTQSTVSKKMASLEQQLDLQLFIRKNKELRLTEAGNYLYGRWKDLPNAIEGDLQTAHTLKSRYKNKIVIAVLDSFRTDLFLEPLLDFLHLAFPALQVDVESGESRKIQEQMLKEQVDAVFTNLFALQGKDCGTVTWKAFGICEGQVGMLAENPLSQKAELEPEDLKESGFVCIAPHVLPEYMEMVKRIGESAGFQPRVVKNLYSAAGMAMNLSQRDEIFLCDRYYREFENKRVTYRPLRGVESGVAMVWRSDSPKKEYYRLIHAMYGFLQELPEEGISQKQQKKRKSS